MTPIAAYITNFLRERLPVEKGCSVHTCETYTYAFQLLFEYASQRFKVTPSKLCLGQIDAPLVMDLLRHLESERDNSPATRNSRLTAIKSFTIYLEY